MKTLKVGIASRDAFKKRTLLIAGGKYKPGKDEPKVWFESLESLAQVLSDQNRALLKLIHEKHPQSLGELAAQSGRAKSSLRKNAQEHGEVRSGPFWKKAPTASALRE